MLPLDTRFKIADTVYFQQLGNEMVLLETGTGKYFGLNPLGARIWALLEQNYSLEAIRKQLISEYDVDPERLDADLFALIDQLVQAGLVHIIQEA